MTLRTGLVGTGPWARMTHGPALAGAPRTTLTAVWGRDLGKSSDLAASLGAEAGHPVTAYDDVDAFLDDVDLVAFAVPPSIQEGIALQAARRGKHLLLEKPIALNLDAGRDLVQAIADSGSAATVFFTQQFLPGFEEWVAEQHEIGGWRAARYERFSPIHLEPAGPFSNSPWRREMGGWWDGGPHLIAILVRVLGPVTAVEAARGPGDLTDAVVWHESGARSTIGVSFDTPGSSDPGWLLGRDGKVAIPEFFGPDATRVDAARAAIAALVAEAVDGAPPHLIDADFGYHVLQVIEAAERAITSGARIDL